MALDRSRLDDALGTLGALLAQRGLSYELAVVGGSSLLLLGLSTRVTQDLDAVALVDGGTYAPADPLPTGLVEATRDVAAVFGLPETWINPGPSDLLMLGLPAGFAERSELRHYGALTLHVASRLDPVHLKLYAAVDQGPRSKHVTDLLGLEPSRAELLQAARWARSHDPSPGFQSLLLDALRFFGVESADAEL